MTNNRKVAENYGIRCLNKWNKKVETKGWKGDKKVKIP